MGLSCIYMCCEQRHWQLLFWTVFPQNVCTANSLWRQKQYLPMEQRESLPKAHYKRSGFLNLAFRISDTTHCVQHESQPLCRTPVGRGEGGKEKQEAHTACCTRGNKVLCLWPQSLVSSTSIHKAVLATLLACR